MGDVDERSASTSWTEAKALIRHQLSEVTRRLDEEEKRDRLFAERVVREFADLRTEIAILKVKWAGIAAGVSLAGGVGSALLVRALS